jgi:predicted DsbA family dithiol-disulfide isomerase
LERRYIEDGTLRLEWRDFPYLGEESRRAAVSARVAHDILYQNQKGENSGAFSDQNLVTFAEEAGLDVERFEEALESGEYDEVVEEDFREAQEAGIQGTPSFTINGRTLVGAQPVETFAQAIEEAQAGNG